MAALTALQRCIRPAIMGALTATVCYLAITGLAEARTAVISGFTLLVGALWGERAALKVPGKEMT